MGVLRSFALIFVCILFFISLLFVGTFATLDSSLNYDIVKPQIKPLMKESLELTPIYNYENIFQDYCLNDSEYFYQDVNTTFVIPCEILANGTEEIIDYQLEVLIEDNYYKNYNCSFWKCFKETQSPFFLVSQYAKDYWNSKFYRFLFFSLIFSGLIFLLIEKKVNFPLLIGILLIISFISISKLDSIGKFVAKMILSSMKSAVEGISSLDLNSFTLIFFSQSNSVFLTGLSIGLILIGAGIFLKLFKTGFKIGRLFSKKEKKESSD